MYDTATSRRALLTGGLLLAAGTAVGATACAPGDDGSTDRSTTSQPNRAESTVSDPSPTPSGAQRSRVLLAYFSRAGENYYNGGRRKLKIGNTEVIAGMISDLIDCDVYRIEAADPYPEGYDATVARNVQEQDADARPEIVNGLESIADYDTVLLGSPIWNVRAPMIMSTFTDSHDFTGKIILPFVTYAVSGLAGVDRDYAAALPRARVGTGLAIRGEEANRGRSRVEAWLRQTDLLTN